MKYSYILLAICFCFGCEDNSASKMKVDNARMEIKNCISTQVILLRIKNMSRVITLNKDTMNYYIGLDKGISKLYDIIEHDTGLNEEINTSLKYLQK